MKRAKYSVTWRNLQIKTADDIRVGSHIASADGKEYSRARWSRVEFKRVDGKPAKVILCTGALGVSFSRLGEQADSTAPLVLPRNPDGNGKITVSGELKQWHKVTLNLSGPYVHEQDNQPNPFTDYRLDVTFAHASGSPKYVVPGNGFAADGKAANSSAKAGTAWRAHCSPDKAGKWTYRVSFVQGKNAALTSAEGKALKKFHGKSGSFTVGKTDKKGRDLRAKGRLQYVGNRYLQFAGKEYFLKAGADAPETFLGYKDFDDTIAGKPSRVPLKTCPSMCRIDARAIPRGRTAKARE